MTSSLEPEIPPVRLPGQRELPCEDGVPMETHRHYEQAHYLTNAVNVAFAARSDVYAAGNMFVYFSPRQLENEHFRGPDVFVVLGTEKKERLSWVLWEELRLPDVGPGPTAAEPRGDDGARGRRRGTRARSRGARVRSRGTCGAARGRARTVGTEALGCTP